MRNTVMSLVFMSLGLTSAHADLGDVVKSSGVTGGVVVHLWCADGRETVKLCRSDSYSVQGLDDDTTNIEAARALVRGMGRSDNLSFDTFDGVHLPYVDNMVNLIVGEGRTDGPESVAEIELMRVLAPRGVAMLKKGGAWTRLEKPVPTNIDQWTHYLHGPDNNAVAQDTVVGPPRRLQWQGGPKWTRHHDCMSSLSGLVSARGRLFYILDEGSTASIFLPSHWALIARDAFNGKILWKRKIADWYSRFKGLKSGPADAPRRLVAVGDRVYSTLSLNGPVACLDAVTGNTIREYAGTTHAEEILVADDLMLVLVGPGSLIDGMRSERPIETRTIKAFQAESGELLWQTADVVAATTLATDGKNVYYFNFDQKKAVCLDRGTGKTVWRSEVLPSPERQTSFFASKLVVSDGVVLFAGGEYSGLTKSGGGETRSDTLTAMSAETGKTIWKAKHPPSGYSSPENLFVIDGTVWCDASSNGRLDGTVVGIDLKTGVEKDRFAADETSYWFHHRCYPGRASSNYIMTSRTGIEFIDFRTHHWDLNHWARGACVYGIMPCNGLIYTPPSPCICYAESYLHSFDAYAPAPASSSPAVPESERLQKGPAYARPVVGEAASADWPTYRCTNSRDGCNSNSVTAELKPGWKTPIGGKLSSVIVAAGKLFVAAVDDHTVHAVDAASGKRLWHFTTGGRVDSPPTYFQGRVLFGSADGHVYCLRADNGELIWRFRAAQNERKILAYEQFESLWPVHGSILVRNGVAWFVAGRSAFVDGGMRLFRSDAKSGELLGEVVIDEHNPATGKNLQELVKWLNMPVARPDILSCDDDRLYMRSQSFDFDGRRLKMGPTRKDDQEGSLQTTEGAHLFCPTGFVDDTWFHRSYWLYGSTWGSGWSGYYIAGKYTPAGKLICIGDDAAYVFGRQPQYYRWTLPLEYRLFAAHKRWQPEETPTDEASRRRTGKKTKGGNKARSYDSGPGGNKANYLWSTTVPILVRAMTLGRDTLFVAGPPDVLDEKTRGRTNPAADKAALNQEASLEGQKGALLWAIARKDGKRLAEYKLSAPPVFDGMATANGCLYFSTVDGHVQCFQPARR